MTQDQVTLSPAATEKTLRRLEKSLSRSHWKGSHSCTSEGTGESEDEVKDLMTDEYGARSGLSCWTLSFLLGLRHPLDLLLSFLGSSVSLGGPDSTWLSLDWFIGVYPWVEFVYGCSDLGSDWIASAFRSSWLAMVGCVPCQC